VVEGRNEITPRKEFGVPPEYDQHGSPEAQGWQPLGAQEKAGTRWPAREDEAVNFQFAKEGRATENIWMNPLDRFCIWLAWLLPRRIVYWCAIRLMANATQGAWSSQIVPDLRAMDALERWRK
jgi:hypothetical protein